MNIKFEDYFYNNDKYIISYCLDKNDNNLCFGRIEWNLNTEEYQFYSYYAVALTYTHLKEISKKIEQLMSDRMLH